MSNSTEPLGIQPVAGSLSAVVMRACQRPGCPHFLSRDCPDHAHAEDLGVIASFDLRKEPAAHG
jgi:hypothetical protein